MNQSIENIRQLSRQHRPGIAGNLVGVRREPVAWSGHGQRRLVQRADNARPVVAVRHLGSRQSRYQ